MRHYCSSAEKEKPKEQLGSKASAEMAFDYMSLQPDATARMRAILVDWLVEVHSQVLLPLIIS